MKHDINDQILTFYPTGDVGKSETLDVNAVHELIREHSIQLVIFDLSASNIITSPGFGWLFGIARECKRLEVIVAICCANELITRSLKWVNAQLVMNICITRTEAIAL